jgi:hypothetical protein
MTGHGEKFTRKKEAALAALLQYATLPEAAAACKLSAATLRRWLGNREFEEAYRSARARMLETTVNVLRKESVAAAKMLAKLMSDESQISQRAGRVSAARSIIALALSGTETLELEERLAELEELAAKEKKA